MTGGRPQSRAQLAQALGPGWRRLLRGLAPSDEHTLRLLLLAVVVGIVSGLLAVGLRQSVHALFGALAGLRAHGWAAVLLPAIGAGLGVFIVGRVFGEPAGHGVPQVIRSVCRKGGRMRLRSVFSRFLGSLVNVSSGGSAGLEGPIVFSAAAAGSTIGGWAKLDERRRTLLLACGAAAGISGVFNAPMTGMIFSMEIVLAEWSALSVVPVVVSAVAGTELSRWLIGKENSFLHVPFDMGTDDLAACAVLGICCGLASMIFVRVLSWTERARERWLPSRFAAPVAFGLLVGLIGLRAPDAIGEGYSTVGLAISGELGGGVVFCLVLLAAKMLATSFTLGAGAPGGVFAPSLVMGSILGAGFARAQAKLLPAWNFAHEGSYALVGMSGLVAGIMQAPLTGLFLVMETTAGYEVVLPLMIVSVISLLVSRHFDRFSLYTNELARMGELLRPGTDRRILADVHLVEALDEHVPPVPETHTLAQFAPIMARSRRNHFPVVRGEDQEYAGMLEVGALRELLMEPQLAAVTLVGTVMETDVETVPLASSLSDALAVFERTGAWVLPVVDGPRFAGLISKSTLFDRYRKELSVQTST